MKVAGKKFRSLYSDAKNLQLIRENNLSMVFSMIYKYGSVSRAQLAKITNLSPTTVSSQVDELLKKKLVVEVGIGEMGTSGRKPVMLNINENGYFFVSIELTKDGFHCCLYNLLCNLVDSRRCGVSDFAALGEELIASVTGLLRDHRIPEDQLLGITVGVPALIDYEEHRVLKSTVLQMDEGNDFYDALRRRFGEVPLFLENESSLCAYAEKVFGSGEDADNLIFIDVGVGIGAGIILNGDLFHGSFGLAGEIGHISIDLNGPKCKCGNRGCLEVMASIPAMVQKIVFSVMSGRETVISGMIRNDLNQIDVEVIGRAVAQADELALEVTGEIAARLAFGINNVINLFNPQAVVIGGEIVKLGPAFLGKLRESLHAIALRPDISDNFVRYSGISENAATLGGARYALDMIFHMPGFLRRNLLPIL